MTSELITRMPTAAFAFRGYNVTNLGKTPELLEHPVYGPTFEKHLKAASEIFTTATLKRVDLIKRVRLREETTLESYGEALCLIGGASLAQLECLREHFGVSFNSAKLAIGYSLGEIVALSAADVYQLDALLIPILKFSEDCVELAKSTRMGIVFSRGPILDTESIERLCVQVTAKGQGTISISTYLSPNTVLVLGQGQSLDLLKAALKDRFEREVLVKENPNRWPPIHTPIVKQRNVPDRASVMIESIPGGHRMPSIPIESCVTGAASYNDFNSREILCDWISRPQKLWTVLEHVLHEDIETMIHVGPEPNLIPATMSRIAANVEEQMKKSTLNKIGIQAVTSITRARPWLAQYIHKQACLLRAPLIENIVLEDWLLANAPAMNGSVPLGSS